MNKKKRLLLFATRFWWYFVRKNCSHIFFSFLFEFHCLYWYHVLNAICVNLQFSAFRNMLYFCSHNHWFSLFASIDRKMYFWIFFFCFVSIRFNFDQKVCFAFNNFYFVNLINCVHLRKSIAKKLHQIDICWNQRVRYHEINKRHQQNVFTDRDIFTAL